MKYPAWRYFGVAAVLFAGMFAFFAAVSMPMVHADDSAAAGAGSSSSPAATASPAMVKFVKFFVDSDISDLPPERIPEFIAIDPETLPKKLRGPFLSRREELLALKKIADGRNKPPIRRLSMDDPGPDQCVPSTNPQMPRILKQAGYDEITEEESIKLASDTKCNECELMVEFTMRKVVDPNYKPKKKTDPPRFLYFLHTKDPLWNLVGMYRAGRDNPFGTNFFGLGHPSCH